MSCALRLAKTHLNQKPGKTDTPNVGVMALVYLESGEHSTIHGEFRGTSDLQDCSVRVRLLTRFQIVINVMV